METESFRERNRRRRQENAFTKLYEYAKRASIPQPRAYAESRSRANHGDGEVPAGAQRGSGETDVPHRLADRTKEELYAARRSSTSTAGAR